MERGDEQQDDREPEKEPETSEEEGSSEDRGGRKGELTEEEKKEQRAEDERKAQERLEEVTDAPPEQHAALQADAAGATIVLLGALFIIVGVIVALAFSPWGWAGVAIGVIDIVIGQMIRRRRGTG